MEHEAVRKIGAHDMKRKKARFGSERDSWYHARKRYGRWFECVSYYAFEMGIYTPQKVCNYAMHNYIIFAKPNYKDLNIIIGESFLIGLVSRE